MALPFPAVCILLIRSHYRWGLGIGYRIWKDGVLKSPPRDSAVQFHSVISKARGAYALDRIISGREDYLDGTYACMLLPAFNPANC